MDFWNLQGGWRCGARVSCLGAFVSVCCGDVGLWVEAQFGNSGSGCVRHGGRCGGCSACGRCRFGLEECFPFGCCSRDCWRVL